MSTAIDDLIGARNWAVANAPAVQGFPYLAEALRQAGVRRNEWHLPAMQSLYTLDASAVMDQGAPLVSGVGDVPRFDREALVDALRADQAGHTTCPEFAMAAWRAGVVRYVVDLDNRTCTYFGVNDAADESYVESYPGVSLSAPVVDAG